MRYDPAVITLPAGSGGLTTQAPARRFSLEECRLPDSEFATVAYGNAVEAGVEHRALMVRTLLHLPRVAGFRGQVSERQISAELHHRAQDLLRDIARVDAKKLVPSAKAELRDLEFVELSNEHADLIFGSLHYLRSARPGSLNFALVHRETRLPYTLCSVSPLEWKLVGRQIFAQFGVPQTAVWDVSRVFSFDLAPQNAISYLLGKLRNRFRTGTEGVKLLATAVDPNLGFSGASYRAANWEAWMTVQARPYLYVNHRYASPRQLRGLYGTTNPAELQERFGRKFEQSRAKLLDSSIFCVRVRGETETVPLDDRRRLRR